MTDTTTSDGPRKHQARARAKARAHGDTLRAWLHGQASKVRDASHRTPTPPGSRGVDRVPTQYADAPTRTYTPIALTVPGSLPSERRPYRNPDRPAKLARNGRLRKDTPT